MCTIVGELAREEGLGVIDAHAATLGHPELFWFDGVHPNAVGAGLIARAAYEVLAPELASS
jgi:acyl-CoA thioesterase-1